MKLPDFDYQWKNIPSTNIEYNQDRITEFLQFTKINVNATIRGKYCLDAGCGNGRYTYVMLRLGAMRVDSFDISPEAVAKCKSVNPNAFVFDIMDLQPLPRPVYDFVLCWGVLNHVRDPRKAFSKVASQVNRSGGMLHIMVYHTDTQKVYEEGRRIWPTLSLEERLRYCEERVRALGGDVHGWFDAFNPQHNWSFTEREVQGWFEEEGFSAIRLVKKYNINMRGQFLH